MEPQDWQSLLREASRLHAAGESREAIDAYQRLLSVNPDLPDSWFNLGWLQRHAREFEAALQSYQRALDLGVARPEEVHLNRATIYSDYLRRPEETQTELAAALDKNPNYVPALLNLGNLHEDLGERDDARDAYQRVLELEPENALALARLATLSVSPELDTALEQRLGNAIDRARAAGAHPAGMMFAHAALLDAAGRYDEAFAAAQAANAESRATAISAAFYDRAATEKFVDRSISAFPAAEPKDGREAPVFICGMYRSGSTLAEQILAAHSCIIASGELDSIPAIAGLIEDYPDGIPSDPQAIQELVAVYLRNLPVESIGDGRVVTDKRPDNFLHLGLIKTLFPDAKIIHTVREPLDNLLSLFFLHLDPRLSYALDLDDAVHWYGQYRRLMAHWEKLYGDDMLTVSYDQLVQTPEAVIREMLGFVGLEWEDSCLEFNRPGQMVRTASVWQVREPLYKSSSGRWRNYERQLDRTREALDRL